MDGGIPVGEDFDVSDIASPVADEFGDPAEEVDCDGWLVAFGDDYEFVEWHGI